MWAMSEQPEQRPEGRLIGTMQKRSGLSQRQAAARAAMSEGHWRAIVSGYRTVNAGVYTPVRGPAETVARMAHVVGVTPEQLIEVGRQDAAEELRVLPPGGEAAPEPTVAELAAELAEVKRANAEMAARIDRIEGREEDQQHHQAR